MGKTSKSAGDHVQVTNGLEYLFLQICHFYMNTYYGPFKEE